MTTHREYDSANRLRRSYPLVYELNTRCWLRELSEARGRPCTLDDVPDATFEGWSQQGFTHLWLMGVWKVGVRSRRFCQRDHHLRGLGAELLPDFRPADLVGSPFAVAGHHVSPTLGGAKALVRFRQRLAARGLGLILDFVPNHTGLDHSWLTERPELYVSAPAPAPGTFRLVTPSGPRWIAHGRDPYFSPWEDTAQLDYRQPATRAAMIAELQDLLRLCDGVRCDMAMLLLNDVFAKTWAAFPPSQPAPASEFWSEAIPAARHSHPRALLVAEVYWDLEARLQELGFDFTYDKRLYDYLVSRNHPDVSRHLLSLTPDFIARSVHFLENHDEPRIASVLSWPEHKAAAVLTLALPGLRLLHEGQLAGATRTTQVQFGRRPVEGAKPEVEAWYELLLSVAKSTSVGRGRGELLAPRAAWPGNPTAESFVLIQWQTAPAEFELVVINLAEHPGQCYAPLQVAGLARHNWRLVDLLGDQVYDRRGDDLAQQGLYLELPGHAAQLFHFSPLA